MDITTLFLLAQNLAKKIEKNPPPHQKVPQMLANFKDTLHLLAWNGYEQEAYKGSMACKETWTDDRILFPKGANMKFGKGRTLLSILAEKMSWYCWWEKEKEERHLARIKKLLALGADPDAVSHSNRSPLLETCLDDGAAMELFKILLSKKVNVNGHPESYWNPLASAAACNAPEKTRLLLEAGADPNHMCKHRSVLHLASIFNESKGEYTETIKLLLKAGANPNLLDINGCSPINECIKKGYIKYAKLMMEYGGIIEDAHDLMATAIDDKNEASIKFLHQHGEPIRDLDWQQAIIHRDIPLVAMLLRCGACPNTPLYDYSPFSWALYKDHGEQALEVVKLLCNAGANVNIKRYSRPFINSLFNEYIKEPQPSIVKMIEVFVSKGAKLPSKTSYGGMLAFAKKDIGEFVPLNRIMMKSRFK